MIHREVPEMVPVGKPITFEGANAYKVEELVNEALALHTDLRLYGGLEYGSVEGSVGEILHRITVTFVYK